MSGEQLDRYLTDVYRRDILGESVEVQMPELNAELIADIKARIAGIEALRLGANLAQRDNALYQNREALKKLLVQLEAQHAADSEGS
jgi:hypothetical protein